MFTEPTDDKKHYGTVVYLVVQRTWSKGACGRKALRDVCPLPEGASDRLRAMVQTGCLAVLNGQMNARFRPPHPLALMPGTVFPRQWRMLPKARGGQSEPKMHKIPHQMNGILNSGRPSEVGVTGLGTTEMPTRTHGNAASRGRTSGEFHADAREMLPAGGRRLYFFA